MAIRRVCRPLYAASGYTIVELLVGVAIIGTLSGLLLPAVQAARESARLTTCKNHVSQLAKAMLRHEAAMGHFPSGGWSPTWLGVAERPADSSQPGGWTFGILPYAEELPTRDMVAGASALTAPSVYQQLATTPLKLFVCPSRRSAGAIPVANATSFSSAAATGITLGQATRSDYAANGGSVGNCPPITALKKVSGNVSSSTKITISHAPPGNPSNCQVLNLPYAAVVNGHSNHADDSLAACTRSAGASSTTGQTQGQTVGGDDRSPTTCASCCTGAIDAAVYAPTSIADGDAWRVAPLAKRLELPDMGVPDMQDGFVHRMSRVTAGHIRDGMSMTYLLGEKFMDSSRYRTGTDQGDSAPLFSGYSSSTTRFGLMPPRMDDAGATSATAFGGPHRAGFSMAFGDGSVRTLPFDIDPAVHESLSARSDGAVVTIPR